MGKHYNRKNKKVIILSTLRILFFVALVISILYIAKWNIDSKQNETLKQKLSDTVIVESPDNKNTTDSDYKIDFAKLKEINNQTVAWLKVNGTDIEYAVVKTDNNSYYLNHNFEKNNNIAGWIFADYKNKFDGTDKNIVVYGHNMKDNSMFGTLKNILEENWYNNEENYVINFVTEKEEQKYQVFSIYKTEKEDYYISTEFNENEFEKFISTLKSRSIKDFNIEVSSEDSILTLSTCVDNNKNRIVLHAKKILE